MSTITVSLSIVLGTITQFAEETNSSPLNIHKVNSSIMFNS